MAYAADSRFGENVTSLLLVCEQLIGKLQQNITDLNIKRYTLNAVETTFDSSNKSEVIFLGGRA